MDLFYEKVKNSGVAVRKNEEMKNHTSFKIGGEVSYFVEPDSAEQIISVINAAKEYGKEFFIIGNGTNLLFPDEKTDKVFISLNEKFNKVECKGEEIYCQSGALMTKACRTALENSLKGMEALFGIPGTVGGGLFMNAGAYGTEMKDVVLRAEVLDKNLNLKTVEADKMDLGYRHSAFAENGEIILSVTFGLEKGDKAEIKNKMDEFIGKRKDKQPLEYPSAGSTFKRPTGYFAGALIEQCGLKGKSIGDAQVSEKHAGFVINKGKATSRQVKELIDLCTETVKEKTGVTLEREVIYVD